MLGVIIKLIFFSFITSMRLQCESKVNFLVSRIVQYYKLETTHGYHKKSLPKDIYTQKIPFRSSDFYAFLLYINVHIFLICHILLERKVIFLLHIAPSR